MLFEQSLMAAQQQQQQTNRGGRRTARVSTERDGRSHQKQAHRLRGKSCGAGGAQEAQWGHKLTENHRKTRERGGQDKQSNHRGERSHSEPGEGESRMKQRRIWEEEESAPTSLH
ncbi:hypothetical protein FQA47_001161 [Oryzias melastigma]|uniref:Uncharacterized protein n=1 Tax=Oryzias melastigma TaxID=30732 RepID=A0A834F4J4_ORYME|nr:hypothetical protein FQA47_001161 [Oryzias melastigma]